MAQGTLAHTAVITGATSGIGLAIARALVADGCTTLIIGGRRGELLAERARELHAAGAATVETVVGDLADEAIAKQFEHLIDRYEVDLLCNNAGFGVGGSVGADAKTDLLVQMIDVHAGIPLRLCAAAMRGMRQRRHGIIINVGSLAGRLAVPGAATYVATKAFTERLSESLAVEAAAFGIVVQALTPGFVKTDFHRDITDDRSHQKDAGLVRWLTAEHVAAASLKAARAARARLIHGRTVPMRRHTVVVPGWTYRLLAAISNAVPRSLQYRAVAR
ncbi:MAG: SDR family NAD(P)-dependent oxidoreductase, partial [Spirochaetaceae bacterium]